MNRIIAIALILSFVASELQAQQPTPARRPSTAATNQVKKAATKTANQATPTAKKAQPVQRAVAVQAAPASNGSVGTGVRRSQPVVQASAHQHGEVIYDEHAPMPMAAGEIVYESASMGCDSCGSGTCGAACGIGPCEFSRPGLNGLNICNPPAGARQLVLCLPSHGWVQADYLGWFQRGMNVPALVTTSSTATGQGILGAEGTSSLLGDELLTDRFDGGRIRFGWWFANNPTLGIELEYFGLGTNEFSFSQRSSGDPILARPFFNVLTGLEDSQLVAQNGVVGGTVRVDGFSEVQGGAIRLRKSLCCGTTCATSFITCGPVQAQSRIDATIGWRTIELNEGLTIREDLQSQLTNDPGSFLIEDSFRTRNQFNGAELGVMWQGRRGYWTLDMLLRTSFGNSRQEVDIAGSTEITEPVGGVQTTTVHEGGLLAQSTNSGSFLRQQFGVVPEFGATLGYQLTDRTRLTAGYTFIYWSNVVRPGDQIDLDVNPGLIPPASPTITGAQRPRFAFRESDYFIQGVNLGAEYRW